MKTRSQIIADMRVIECKHDKLEQENADLRAQLEAAELLAGNRLVDIGDLYSQLEAATARAEKAANICREVEVILCGDNLIKCNGDCIDCEMNDRAGKVMRKLRYGATLKAVGGE